MENPRIVRIEVGRLTGQRPRHAGSNARLGAHGKTIEAPIARLTTEDGASGFGVCRLAREQAVGLVGGAWADAFSREAGVTPAWQPCEYAVWDLAGQRAGLPVYALAAAVTGRPAPAAPFRAPCYDTSLYFDDLHLPDDGAAAALIASEARAGYEQGHRAFKIKVGRGARHLPLDTGTRRDIAVVQAVRDAVGPGIPLLLDANNGYNLNLTKQVLAATAAYDIFWIEEAFHEDPVLYQDLRQWLADQGLPILIADGEGQAAPTLMDWAREAIVDVVQYDIFSHGFTRWLATGRQLDAWGARSAPHHYGGHYGNYAAGHLAGGIERLTYVEWDDAHTPGLDTTGYTIDNGWVTIPNSPGFGLHLDDALFQEAVESTGFVLEA